MAKEKQLLIEVRDKIATLKSKNFNLVGGNNDYDVVFDFDEDWQYLNAKTAIFVFDNENPVYVPFDGNVCAGVAINDATMCLIGVFSGDLRTTTPAVVDCVYRSILDEANGTPAPPKEDVYNQIIDLINKYIKEIDIVGKYAPLVDGKVPAENIPTAAFDIIRGYFNSGGTNFHVEGEHNEEVGADGYVVPRQGVFYFDMSAPNAEAPFAGAVCIWRGNGYEKIATVGEFEAALQSMKQYIDLKIDVVQETGGSDTSVMSQKATTDEIDAIKSDLVDFKTNQPNLFMPTGSNLLDESLLVDGKRLLSNGNIDNLASCCATESFIDISNIKDSHLAAYYTAFDGSPIRCCYRLSFYSVADVSGHLKTYSCNSDTDLSIAICEIPNGANFVRVSYAVLTTSVHHFMLISGKSDMKLINYEKWQEKKITVVPADLNEQLANINEQIARSSYPVHHDNAEFTITKLINSYTFNQNDFTFVKDELWLAKHNPTDFSNGTGIFRHKWNGEQFVHTGTINCDFGHWNVVDYCEANDCLIFGNGANDFETAGNYFVVVPHPLELGDTALISDVGIKYNVDIGYKVQALWGHSNFGKNNIVVLLSNDLKSINTVMLNKDENGAFDGTYITLDSVNNLTAFGIQGADIWGDTLYVGGQIIENEINYHAICELSLSDYSQRIIKRKFHRDDGSVMGGCVQGIYVNDNSIWVFDNSDNPQTGECCYLTKYRR